MLKSSLKWVAVIARGSIVVHVIGLQTKDRPAADYPHVCLLLCSQVYGCFCLEFAQHLPSVTQKKPSSPKTHAYTHNTFGVMRWCVRENHYIVTMQLCIPLLLLSCGTQMDAIAFAC